MRSQWSIQVIRGLFLLISAATGIRVASGYEWPWWQGVIAGLAAGGFVVGMDALMRRFTLRHLGTSVFGLLVGLLTALLITQAVSHHPWFESMSYMDRDSLKTTLQACLYPACAFLGISIALRSDREEFAFIIPYVRFRRDASEGEPVLLDTNIVIDGRIPRLFKTGFLTGTLVIPRLVLDELQRLADSHDPIKAERGKRGLSVLEFMRAMPELDLTIHEDGSFANVPVDTRLVMLARELNARLLTNDENLAQVARLRGISVLSINELSRAVQSELSAGDEIEIALVKPGRDKHQAVGYLPDGAMIVVNQGVSLIGRTVRVAISGTTQTSAGRLIFADIVNG